MRQSSDRSVSSAQARSRGSSRPSRSVRTASSTPPRSARSAHADDATGVHPHDRRSAAPSTTTPRPRHDASRRPRSPCTRRGAAPSRPGTPELDALLPTLPPVLFEGGAHGPLRIQPASIAATPAATTPSRTTCGSANARSTSTARLTYVTVHELGHSLHLALRSRAPHSPRPSPGAPVVRAGSPGTTPRRSPTASRGCSTRPRPPRAGSPTGTAPTRGAARCAPRSADPTRDGLARSPPELRSEPPSRRAGERTTDALRLHETVQRSHNSIERRCTSTHRCAWWVGAGPNGGAPQVSSPSASWSSCSMDSDHSTRRFVVKGRGRALHRCPADAGLDTVR